MNVVTAEFVDLLRGHRLRLTLARGAQSDIRAHKPRACELISVIIAEIELDGLTITVEDSAVELRFPDGDVLSVFQADCRN